MHKRLYIPLVLQLMNTVTVFLVKQPIANIRILLDLFFFPCVLTHSAWAWALGFGVWALGFGLWAQGID
jgi:hypothetical protein